MYISNRIKDAYNDYMIAYYTDDREQWNNKEIAHITKEKAKQNHNTLKKLMQELYNL